MGGMGGAAETAAKTNKIAQQGVKHPAVLKGMRETGNKDPLSGGVEYELEVEVRPTGGEPYTATFAQQIIAQSADDYKQKIGGEIVVNVDPDDPQDPNDPVDTNSRVTFALQPGAIYFILANSFDPKVFGNYQLTVTATAFFSTRQAGYTKPGKASVETLMKAIRPPR